MYIFMLSSITAVVLVLTGSLIFFRKYSHISQVAFFLGALSTAAALTGDSLCILRPDLLLIWKHAVFAAEAVMATSWYLFSISFARSDYWGSCSRFSKLLLTASVLFIYFFTAAPEGDFLYFPGPYDGNTLFIGNTGYFFNLLVLIYSVVSIVNLESTFRNTVGTTDRQIKYTLIGTGGILAVNAFYYSYVLLYGSLNISLLPVRDGVILVSGLLTGFSVLRNKTMSAGITISRKIFYRSLSVFVIGFYLLGLGTIKEGMAYLDPRIGKNITIFFGFTGAMLVLTILLSERLQRKAAVFINKNFYRSKYDYRAQWLRFTQRISLNHTFDELLKSIAEGFQEAIGSQGAAIWLKRRDVDQYACVTATWGEVIKAKPGKELAEFLQEKQWVLNVYDDKCKEIAAGNREFIEKAKASLIVPLLHIDRLIGFVLLKESPPGNEYNYEDYDLLKTLANQSTSVIVNAQLSEELTEAKEMEAMGKLSSFILHDLKNAASMLSLISQNAEAHIGDPDFQRDAAQAVFNTSKKIGNIIEKLKDLPCKTELELDYSDLGACVRSAVGQFTLHGSPGLSFRETGPVYARFDREEINKVVINLIMNALDAVGSQGEINVTVGRGNPMGFIKVSDNGPGMSRDFIEKNLFRPFQTTKEKGLGIGLYQCKAIVAAHSGKLIVQSTEGKGADFTVFLPIDNLTPD